MILKYGNAGNQIDISDAPDITFSGRWKKWALEFYDGILYWEAWFFSSGTLTVIKEYTIDAWGLGGGAATERSDRGSVGGAGVPNMVIGAILAPGSTVVTIGAGGDAAATDKDAPGGTTSLGSILSCSGGSIVYTSNGSHNVDVYNRFGDTAKAEYGYSGSTESRLSDGWLDVVHVNTSHTAFKPHGIGAGVRASETLGSSGSSGALVIRIPV